jgi:alpha-amylase
MSIARFLRVVLIGLLLVAAAAPALAQAGLGDDRVMLQGFYWESCRHGNSHFPQFGDKRWYQIVADRADDVRAAHFDLIWLPPPCYSGDPDDANPSAGYNPKQYFTLDNCYGAADQQLAALKALLEHGVEPVADLVLNHRDGNTGWVDFKNPDWDTKTITRDDEAFTADGSPVKGLPEAQRGNPEEPTPEYAAGRKTTYAYASFRDIDHTNPTVRRDVLRYMLMLKSAGYRGWRYDMVHGYHAKHIGDYNGVTKPTFSVGEYDWDKHNEMRGWVWWTFADPNAAPQGTDHLVSCSSVFDFTTFYGLKAAKGNYGALYGFGAGIGIVADNTDKVEWKHRAVTFVENHDTGYRTDPNGAPQSDHKFDSFANNWEVEQAYAQILTHPGVPCVYWKHYFDWGQDLQNKIRALINARKVAAVHAGSEMNVQDNARMKGVYAARVVGSKGELYVRIGGGDDAWQPSDSGYGDYREYARGAGWTVWVKLPGNPPFQQAALKDAFAVPTFTAAETIEPPP